MEILSIIEIVLFVTLIIFLVVNVSLKVFLKRTRKENAKELNLFIKMSETKVKEQHFSNDDQKTIDVLIKELKLYRKKFCSERKSWLNTSTFKYIHNDREVKKIMDKLTQIFKK